MISLQNMVSLVRGETQQQLLFLRSMIVSECPTISKALRLIDREYTTVQAPKGYSLMKRENRKLGFVYYVRYRHNGKALPSKWCTHTNSYDKACKFAEENKEKIIARYLGKAGGEAERFFARFYEASNPAFQNESRRNREISEAKRRRYKSIIKKSFIPFLRENNIQGFNEITVPRLNDFQDYLLRSGIKPQTVNDYLIAVKKVMSYLFRKGIIQENPCVRLAQVPERAKDKQTHGCYEIEKLHTAFSKEWQDKGAYLLNLLIYTTGMRNCEIKSFSKNDITIIDGCHFIDLKKSKTKNGMRLVPLHDELYKRIIEHAKNKENTEKIFAHTGAKRLRTVVKELAKQMGVSEEYRRENNITFYSGRHAWKTMMNAGGLGEAAEEIFMGHRVTGDVAKLYNHKDKQGKELLVKKAGKVFEILDKYIFGKTQP